MSDSTQNQLANLILLESKKVTRELVFELADSLEAHQILPTVARIRTLNRDSGSATTITPLLKEWKQARESEESLTKSILDDELKALAVPFLRKLLIEVSKPYQADLERREEEETALIEQLQQKDERRIALEQELQQARAKISELESSGQSKEEKISFLQTQIEGQAEQLSEQAGIISSLKEELSTAQQNEYQAKAKADMQSERHKVQIAEKDNDIESLNGQLDQKQSEIELLKAELSKAQQDSFKSEALIEANNERINGLKQDIDRYRLEAQSASQENRQVYEENRSLQQERWELSQEVNRLKALAEANTKHNDSKE